MKQEYKWNVTNIFMKCIHVVLTLNNHACSNILHEHK